MKLILALVVLALIITCMVADLIVLNPFTKNFNRRFKSLPPVNYLGGINEGLFS